MKGQSYTSIHPLGQLRPVTGLLYFTFYLVTYLLAPWSRVLKKLTSSQLVKKLPALYRTQMFISFTSAHHLSLS
jgi:hypothetical protein